MSSILCGHRFVGLGGEVLQTTFGLNASLPRKTHSGGRGDGPSLFGSFVLSLNELCFSAHHPLSGLPLQSSKCHDQEPQTPKEKKFCNIVILGPTLRSATSFSPKHNDIENKGKRNVFISGLGGGDGGGGERLTGLSQESMKVTFWRSK